MVKNYRGVPVQKATKKTQKVTVADYMTSKLITFTVDQHMDEVIDILLKNKISGAPVVSKTGEVVGVISEGDCMKEVVKGKYNNMPTIMGQVKEYMTQKVISISPETNIFDAAKMFLEKGIRRFPVINHGKLVGQISQKDIMRAVNNMHSQTW